MKTLILLLILVSCGKDKATVQKVSGGVIDSSLGEVINAKCVDVLDCMIECERSLESCMAYVYRDNPNQQLAQYRRQECQRQSLACLDQEIK